MLPLFLIVRGGYCDRYGVVLLDVFTCALLQEV
jgi:hypothetical protein